MNTAVAAIESTIGEDDTQGLRLRIKTNEDDIDTLEGKVTTLIGEDAGKSARAISAEEVAKIVADADEDYDTLKEIADYIKSDKTGAAQMQTDISTIKSDLNTAETGLKARMTAAEGEIDALQESVAGIHTHDNKAVLDGITTEKVTAWDAAEANAKTFATTKIGLAKEDGGEAATTLVLWLPRTKLLKRILLLPWLPRSMVRQMLPRPWLAMASAMPTLRLRLMMRLLQRRKLPLPMLPLRLIPLSRTQRTMLMVSPIIMMPRVLPMQFRKMSIRLAKLLQLFRVR